MPSGHLMTKKIYSSSKTHQETIYLIRDEGFKFVALSLMSTKRRHPLRKLSTHIGYCPLYALYYLTLINTSLGGGSAEHGTNSQFNAVG